MSSQTITIPAREVRPGDVLFGMAVETSANTAVAGSATWFIWGKGLAMNIEPDRPVTVERPVPSDPVGTVRGRFSVNDECHTVYIKIGIDNWEVSGGDARFGDAYATNFPILWKPGMPIRNTEAKA